MKQVYQKNSIVKLGQRTTVILMIEFRAVPVNVYIYDYMYAHTHSDTLHTQPPAPVVHHGSSGFKHNYMYSIKKQIK